MKKKIIAITLAVSAMMSTVAFAENINANYTDNVLSFEQTDENIAVVSCYDENGKLCYSNMLSLRTAISVPIYLKSIRG